MPQKNIGTSKYLHQKHQKLTTLWLFFTSNLSNTKQMRNILLGFGIILMAILWACGPKEYKSIGNSQIVVFNNEHLYFAPGSFNDTISGTTDSIYRLMDGRILMKKVKLPVYHREVKLSAKMTIASAGDRWDKSGSCFVIPSSSAINFIDIHNKRAKLPEPLPNHRNQSGIAPTPDYQPAVELIRFMTPFGIGHFNDKMDLRKPVYIPKWEEKVVWEQDITDRLSLLENEVWVGVWIDTWTKEGYTVSMELNYIESPHATAGKKNTKVMPVLNTIYYMQGQPHPDIFAYQDVDVNINIPREAENVRLNYITTGHGGHSGGDEFVQKNNIVKFDGKEIINFIPWRNDCASFRRFNPGSGLWLVQDSTEYISRETNQYERKQIEERLASSDLSRSNWCPGSDVLPVEVTIEPTPGDHTITFSIPEAQPAQGEMLNHWLVSCYLTWEE